MPDIPFRPSTKHRNAAMACLLATTAIALVGCQLHSDIVSATSHREGLEEIVQVTLRSADASSIKRRQLYFSIVVDECGERDGGFPAEPYIDGALASKFGFAVDDKPVTFTGRVPARIFDTYQRPCAYLRGGGYFTGKLASPQVAIGRTAEQDGIQPSRVRQEAQDRCSNRDCE